MGGGVGMEFNKNRIYTAVNADELKIGSTVYVSDNMYYLKKCVEESLESSILTSILSEKEPKRFCISNNEKWQLVYLIEPKYKPFESVEKAMEAIKKHGGWVKWKDDDIQGLVVGKSDDRVKILQDWVLPEELFEGYVFADDGSPCGELEL